MHRIHRMTLLTSAFLTFIASVSAEELAGSRPNILFIYADDQSYKTLSCYPEAFPYAKTPHIDGLASRGIRFTGAYLGAWCMPSRATLLTGLQPHAMESMTMEGAYPGSKYDPERLPFWPRELRRHGYHTAQIGKWHTGIDSGTGRDWDHQIVWNRPKYPENAGHYYEDQILEFNGEVRRVGGYSTDNYTDWACDYIRGEHRDAAKPWYLWLCYGAVHGPSTPADRHRGQYADGIVPIPADIFGPRPDKPEYLDRSQAWIKGPDGLPVFGRGGEAFGDEGARKARTFAAWHRQMNECVPAIDEGVGRLLQTLKETGQLDNTLIVYTADQGFGMGEHGFRTKLGPYDATYRSPFIVSWPSRLPMGVASPHCVGGADLVVTFLALAGLEPPWKMHGRNLLPLWSDPASSVWSTLVLFEHTGRNYGSEVAKAIQAEEAPEHSNVPWYFALRDGDWKYVRYTTPGEMEELYDLKHDPEELKNLAALPEHRPRLTEARAKLLTELRTTDATFVDDLPVPSTAK